MTPGKAVGSHADLPFAEVFDDLVDEAGRDLTSLCPLGSLALASVQEDLLRLLSGICAWPLLAAFTIFRREARTVMPPKNEVYRDFVRLLKAGATNDFLAEYPELFRLVSICIKDWKAANQEFLLRLEQDRGELEKLFGPGVASEITSLDPALSDRHAGRTVLGVTFASGLKLIYKPRDMMLERSYFGLLEWLNSNGAPIDYRVVKILEKPGYGWAECMDHEPCPDESRVRDYFTRAGALQCLLWALHATDAHMGNVLAAGAYPVLVDAECLLQPQTGAAALEDDEEAAEGLLRAALLPRPKLLRGEVPDLSGLGGNIGQTTDFRIPVWSCINTDAMSLRFVAGDLLPQNNLPVLDGQRMAVSDYRAEFLTGFQKMYPYLMERRQALLAPGSPLQQMFSCRTRVLLRSTRSYVALINRSLRPRYLRDGALRSTMLRETIASQALDLSQRVLDKEVASLADLNVPYFTAAATAATLVAGEDIRMEGYFDTSGQSVVEARLANLGEADLRRQLDLLRALFALSFIPA
jgi:type 2 lantibiotic biosynthesis protein LanM